MLRHCTLADRISGVGCFLVVVFRKAEDEIKGARVRKSHTSTSPSPPLNEVGTKRNVQQYKSKSEELKKFFPRVDQKSSSSDSSWGSGQWAKRR